MLLNKTQSDSNRIMSENGIINLTMVRYLIETYFLLLGRPFLSRDSHPNEIQQGSSSSRLDPLIRIGRHHTGASNAEFKGISFTLVLKQSAINMMLSHIIQSLWTMTI